MEDGTVLVTGATGLLGTWLLKRAPRPASVVAVTHRQAIIGIESVAVDLRDSASTLAMVANVRPSLILHAAYAKDSASIVETTRNVVDAADAGGASVVFISTDAVFEGDGRRRDEFAVPDAMWDYGRWKASAERIVLANSEFGAVVRLPLLVSVEPDDHVVREIRAGAENAVATKWFTNEYRRPAFASEIAAAVWRIAALPPEQRSGCWHLAGPQRLSRYEIAQRIVASLGISNALIEPDPQPNHADRPRDIALSDERARAVIHWQPSRIS